MKGQLLEHVKLSLLFLLLREETVGLHRLSLRLDVDELSGTIALVAHHAAGGPIEVPQAGCAQASEHAVDGGGDLPQSPGDPMRPLERGLALPGSPPPDERSTGRGCGEVGSSGHEGPAALRP